MPIQLLIVDDSDLIRASLRALLGSVAGIAAIREATTLAEALDSVRRDPPTLVILDMNLPDGLGIDIIQQLKQRCSHALWLAVLTIHADPLYRQRCLALGADWFFDKATETDLLLEVVRQFAAQNPMISADLYLTTETTD
ncbi:MAG: response regulator transcription factor [Rhodoferax sp.]|jgi:DNA-binding NarL/FixJ family response regulator|nr:response regulator transcription factor [Rhodoferax sp.]